MFPFLLLLVISQVGLLIFSPRFKHVRVFGWYYTSVYYPLFTDYSRYRWKYWLVPVFYGCILVYCVHLFYSKLYHIVRPHLLGIEALFIPLLVASTSVSGVLSVFVEPLQIEAGPQFEPDYIIFYPNILCQTCRVIKAPRSKHCPICGRCMPLHDHHCIWLNNCIGYGNYEYFYLFLVSNCILLTYASLRLLSLIQVTAIRKDRFFLPLYLLTTAFCVIAVVFTYYQLKLVHEGMTNNEQDKWFVLQEYMRDGNLFKDSNGSFYFRHLNHKNLENAQSLEPGPDSETIYYSTNLYDHKKYHPNNPIQILNHEEITNIYDTGGFWKNLKERIYLLHNMKSV